MRVADRTLTVDLFLFTLRLVSLVIPKLSGCLY